MVSDGNFELISYNPFTVNDNFFNSKSDPDINFCRDISPLDTKYFNLNEIREGFECLCKDGFSVFRVNIRSINKNFETFKHFYSALNCAFHVICFSETWAADNSIYNNSNYQMEDYIVLHKVKESARGILRIFVHKEVYLKPCTDVFINSSYVESLCIEIHDKKDRNILVNVMYSPPNSDMTAFVNSAKTCFLQMIKH